MLEIKNISQIETSMESLTGQTDQEECRISELEDKIEKFKWPNKDKCKIIRRYQQEFRDMHDSLKRQKLQVIDKNNEKNPILKVWKIFPNES